MPNTVLILEEDDGDMNCVGTAECSCTPDTPFEFNVHHGENVVTVKYPDRYVSKVCCPRCGAKE